jgi:hypothetical protein
MSLAYNSIGRPVSVEVTLKAQGPLHVRTEEERRYQQYIVDELPIPQTTYRPHTQPPTLPPRPRPQPQPRPTPYYPPVFNVTAARPSSGKLTL